MCLKGCGNLPEILSNDFLVNELKLDLDCVLDKDELRGYIRNIVLICQDNGIKVKKIAMCRSKRKGLHFYISIEPPINPEKANYLQLLLGDDAQRFVFNKARIKSGLPEWNKLFEEEKIRFRIIYIDE